MGNENAERLQTSILNNLEKKAVGWLCPRQPEWVNSDMLTYLGVAAAVLYTFFCWMANYNANWFWLSSFFLLVNWYGDSLDGTMARYRGTTRPKYGFFIDHSMDAITTCLFCIGMGVSPMMQLSIALFIMGGYLCMSIFTYLSTIILGKFPLTYAKLGPTEMRLILIAVSIFYIYNPWPDFRVDVCDVPWSIFDFAGAAVAAGLFIIYIVSVAKDLKDLAKVDPPKPYHKPKA